MSSIDSTRLLTFRIDTTSPPDQRKKEVTVPSQPSSGEDTIGKTMENDLGLIPKPAIVSTGPGVSSYLRKWMQALKDPSTFKEVLPKLLVQIAEESDKLMPIGLVRHKGLVYKHDPLQIKIRHFINQAYGIFFSAIYEPFAKQNGYIETRKHAILDTAYDRVKSFKELSEAEKERWTQHLDTGTLPPEVILGALEALLGLLQSGSDFRSSGGTSYPKEVCQEFVRTKYDLVAQFLPDLSDEEARRLFWSERPTAAEVQTRASICRGS